MVIENLCQYFIENPSQESAIHLLKTLFDKKEINTCLLFSSKLTSIFPYSFDIRLYHARCLKQTKQYELSLETYDSCFDLCKISHDKINTIRKERNECISHLKYNQEHYHNSNVQTILNRKKNMFPQLTLTMTSCKRLDLFKRTVNSFLNCCLDTHLIDRWICIDDNSSEEDRNEMKRLYPFFEFVFKDLENKGHSRSMNIILDMVKTPYLLHLEDDWSFFAKSNIVSNCLSVIKDNDKIGQCLINYNYSETEEQDITGGQLMINNSGDNFILHKHSKPGSPEYNSLVKGLKQNCVYWPHFSFRPSLIQTSTLKEIGKFNEQASHFEMEYAERYTKAGYTSAFLNRIFCVHTGKLTYESQEVKKNAYALNGESQFVKTKEEKEETPPESKTNIWCRVVNLNRRSDRWENMKKQLEQRLRIIPFSRYEAVDGKLVEWSRKLQCLFAPNDYRMRRGIVGCALSHIKILKDCVKHDNTVIVLEDDVELVEDFESHVLKLNEKMKKMDWDLIYLGHTLRPGVDQPLENGCFKRNTRESIRYSLGGTGGYMINPNGAKRLLDFIEKNGMTNAIDTIQQLFANDGNVFYVNPRMVLFDVDEDTDIQRDFDTTLDMDEKNVIIKESEVWDRWEIDTERILISPTPVEDNSYHTYQITKNTYINIPLDIITEQNRKELCLTRL